jgi:hypothetical protein
MTMYALHNGLVSLIFVSRFGLANIAAALSGQHLPQELIPPMEATITFASTVVGVFDFLYVVIFVILVALWLRYQRRVIRYELAEEINNGLITREEWEIMPRYIQRSKWYWQLLRQGRVEQWKLVRRVHNELADLAFLKWRLRKLGGGRSHSRAVTAQLIWGPGLLCIF